jgi:hypothetical protein
MGGGGKPKAPPPPSPAPSKTSADVAQEADVIKRKMLISGGRGSTILTEQTNPAGGKTLLGQ